MVSELTRDDRVLITTLYRQHNMPVETIAEKWEVPVSDIRQVIAGQEAAVKGLKKGRRSPYTIAEIRLFLKLWSERSEGDTYKTVCRRFMEKVDPFDAAGRVRVIGKACAARWINKYVTNGEPITNAADSTNGIDTV